MRFVVSDLRFRAGHDVEGEIWLVSSSSAWGGFAHVSQVMLELVTATRALQYAEVGERQRPESFEGWAPLFLEKSATDEIRVLAPDWSETAPFAGWQAELHSAARSLLSACADHSSDTLSLLAAHVPAS